MVFPEIVPLPPSYLSFSLSPFFLLLLTLYNRTTTKINTSKVSACKSPYFRGENRDIHRNPARHPATISLNAQAQAPYPCHSWYDKEREEMETPRIQCFYLSSFNLITRGARYINKSFGNRRDATHPPLPTSCCSRFCITYLHLMETNYRVCQTIHPPYHH